MKNCVTHHHACDCREEVFKKLLDAAKMTVTLYRAANNKTELWEAWVDNHGETMQNIVAEAEAILK